LKDERQERSLVPFLAGHGRKYRDSYLRNTRLTPLPVCCLTAIIRIAVFVRTRPKIEKNAMKSERFSQLLLSFCLTGMLAWGTAATSFAGEARFQGQSLNWRLTGGRVVYPGDTLTIDRSTLMTGFMVEAVAASSNGPVRKGVFRAILTAFSPVERCAGRNPDFWYLAGKWTITEAGEDGGRLEFRQDGVVLEGNLAAEGVLNAIAERGVFGAPVRFLMTLVGSCTGKGEGIFLGHEGFEGHIRMTLAPGKKD
jgi:hypothetical protein